MLSQTELLRQKLISYGYDGLFELLPELIGLRLGGRFVLKELFNLGGQSLLWRAADLQIPHRPALVRMALLPYQRPAYLKEDDILHARHHIEFEAKILRTFSQTTLPAYYGLYYAHNSLQAPERGPSITETEPYLVLEFIQGSGLDQWGRLLHSAIDLTRMADLSELALNVTGCMIQLNQTLVAGGYLYADISARNLLVVHQNTNALRVVDAGGILPLAPQKNIPVPFTWDYIPPDYYSAYKHRQNLWPTEASVLYAVGKLLWQIMTARQPIPGSHPDLKDPGFMRCPDPIRHFIGQLIQCECRDFNEAAGLLPGLKTDLTPYLRG